MAAALAACGSTAATTPTSAPPSDVEGGDASRLPALPSPTTAAATPSASATPGQIVTAVFHDIQATWQGVFVKSGLAYSPATLRLFSSELGTACGTQASEVGPFYCPADQVVGIDLTFFSAMERQFGVGGFATAYVIAHEVGHHIQLLLGITARVAAADARNPAGANALSVRFELQADCLAGAWAHSAYTRALLQPGAIEQALHAAAVVGDDFLTQVKGGQVEPENWTHGSSAQRQRWFTAGFDSGSPAACDTYSGSV
jgi:predicted metalloprotease